ncbi:diaminobutyrate--2-oxoglutarate transaminase family protein [Streptomyces albireticuli]|uniref:Diaminobutyrate--2-oxoglutarate transaminase n=1 Tax=Streptomyces albireticuli TaxID=1940 RepID=A0A2A2D1U9_9ACTN|nr:diaminobutyrate--2-oxoglutarate transaminase family protein [Streptomyces albireticuli]MCD9194312.1 diaminobutyrate--2-oxoglutarate transaminase family protein [Streptomyces albireticuli]PAU45504.1 aspartate aminotransferase family protein [Streptomyces albireticuli]
MSSAEPTPAATEPEMEGILRRQDARESSARTYARHLRIVPVRASGMTVEGADGRTYLDCLSGAGTLALGHNHPVAVEAMRKVIDSGRPMHTLDIATPEKDAFTEALFATLPPALARTARIQFCSPAGTDAVEAALKLARSATGRQGLAAFTGAYHGMTTGALAVSGGVAAKARVGGFAGDVTRLPYPYPYRCPLGLGGDLGACAAAEYARRLLADPNGGVVPPAAMILEPVQGEGGVVPAPADWLRAMREITRQHGIPLIADEVQTGMGRTGTLWASEHAGVVPDVLVASKAIGGGLPLAVVVYRGDLDVWEPGAHAGTFRGTTLAMATGAATLGYITENRLAERAASLGTRMLARLEELRARYAHIGDVRGRGLMLGVELVDPEGEPDILGSLPADPALARAVRAACLDRGLIVELGGRHDTVVRLLPPLIISDDEAETVLERFTDALEASTRAAR